MTTIDATAATPAESGPARDLVVITAVGFLFFAPALGLVHLFDWDEVNFAECAREMLLTGNYTQVQINFQPFWEKPPLFFWLQVLSMRAFGINEVGARFVNALCGIATLSVVYLIGRRLFDRQFGRLWALASFGSFLPSVFFRSGVIDPVFNLLTFLGVYALSTAAGQERQSQRRLPFLVAGLFVGLAMLAKGPVALVVVTLTLLVYWVSARFARIASAGQLAVFALAVCLVASLFYGTETAMRGTWYLREFLRYHVRLFSTGDAGHGRPWWFHPVVILLGCFPASFFALRGFIANLDDRPDQREFRKWMLALFWVVLVLFSIVRTKTVLYSSLTYLPVTFLAAYHMRALAGGSDRRTVSWRSGWTVLLAIFAAFIGGALIAFPLIVATPGRILPYVRDPFARAVLERPVTWYATDWLIGVGFLVAAGVAVLLVARRRLAAACWTIFLASAVTLQFVLVSWAPKVEAYTQASPIAFYRSLRGERCYVKSTFKTYTDLFYWEKKPGLRKESYDLAWLLTGDIDRPAYFVCRLPDAGQFITRYNLTVVQSDYGFVYLKREVPARGSPR